MAYEVGNQAISVPASTDLSAKQFLFGSIGATGRGGDRRGPCRGRRDRRQTRCGGSPVRALYQTRNGGQGDVRRAVSNGDLLDVDGAGKAITHAAGKIVARALAAGAGDGSIIPALLILQR